MLPFLKKRWIGKMQRSIRRDGETNPGSETVIGELARIIFEPAWLRYWIRLGVYWAGGSDAVYAADPVLVMSIFVSYAHEDERWAREFIAELSQKGVEVADAYSNVTPGENLALQAGRALERADAVIVLVSPAAARSPNVRSEIQYALGSERFTDRLIPIIVRPTDKVPWILEHLDPVKGGSPSEISNRVAKRLKVKKALA